MLFRSFVAHDVTPAKPAASPPIAWTGRPPIADGESTLLGAGAPPPRTTDGDTTLATMNRIFQVVNRRNRLLSDSGEGGALSMTPWSRERGQDGRSAAKLPRSRTDGGEDHRHQKHSGTTASATAPPAATPQHTPNLHTHRDPWIPRPPAAEAAAGGRGIGRIAGGELMRTGSPKDSPSQYCRWGKWCRSNSTTLMIVK